MDITLLTSQGITPFEPEIVDHGVGASGFQIKSKYQYHVFNSSEEYSSVMVRFLVQRFINGQADITYFYDAIADDSVSVDKDGNIVADDDPSRWGTEMDRMRVLFSAPISNKDILTFYQQNLFERGKFDFPKNRVIN